jgi:hypothetical protein
MTFHAKRKSKQQKGHVSGGLGDCSPRGKSLTGLEAFKRGRWEVPDLKRRRRTFQLGLEESPRPNPVSL